MRKAQWSVGLTLVMAALISSAVFSATAPDDSVVVDADICAVLSNPFEFDHKLLRITGLIVRDFETFWIENPKCPDASPLWIEYGGPKPADGIVWHERPTDPPEDATLVIEGIKTSLVADVQFRRFDLITKSLKRGKRVRATLIGWIVAGGVEKDDAGNEQDVGYGPYRMYSLLVIKKVDAVSRR